MYLFCVSLAILFQVNLGRLQPRFAGFKYITSGPVSIHVNCDFILFKTWTLEVQ